MPEEIEFEHEEGGTPSRVCDQCGAKVVVHYEDAHRRFHDRVEPDDVTASLRETAAAERRAE